MRDLKAKLTKIIRKIKELFGKIKDAFLFPEELHPLLRFPISVIRIPIFLAFAALSFCIVFAPVLLMLTVGAKAISTDTSLIPFEVIAVLFWLNVLCALLVR